MIYQSIILKKEAAVDKNCGVVLQGQKTFQEKGKSSLDFTFHVSLWFQT
jgi:hypothetical protein